MTDWRRQLGMVPREIRDRVPKHMQWRLNEQMARIAQDPEKTWRNPIAIWCIPRRIGRFTINEPTRFVILVCWLAFLFILALNLINLAPQFGIPSSLAAPVLLGMSWMVLWAIRGTANPTPSEMERLAWRALNRMGIRTCEACGYDCQAITADRCPECGGELPTIDQIARHAESEAKWTDAKVPHP